MQTEEPQQATSAEEQELREALIAADGSPSKAAEILGVTRMTVWRRMKRYGIAVVREPRITAA